MFDVDDDVPQLSAETLAALAEFYAEKHEKESKSCLQFEEDWQLSQFWYSEASAQIMAKEALRAAGPSGKIALVSCPSLFLKVKEQSPDAKVVLLEYDCRFAAFGDSFVFYDYNHPLNIPANLRGEYSVVFTDPPFLSEECLRKTALTVKFLAKDKIVLCTGASMEILAEEVLGVKKCHFAPEHKKKLGNKFYCYANYDMDRHL